MRTLAQLSTVALILAANLACDPTVPPPVEPDPNAVPCEGTWLPEQQPETIDVYRWGGEEVYHVDFGCCDMYLEVYDLQCNYLCAPSGGFIGTGDGTCPDFYSDATWVETTWTAQ